MTPSRRDILLGSLGLALTGCAGSQIAHSGARPGARWPDGVARPQPRPHVDPPPTYPRPQPARPADLPVSDPANLKLLPRSIWATAGPDTRDINPMKGVNRITVHHEGWKVVRFTDQASTAARIEQIRRIHTRDRRWADIGYHFIVDRSGQLWQGRDLRYQGAHVRNNNEHNIGVLVLGNFDKQSPTQAQTGRLVDTLRKLQTAYRVPTRRIYTHQEINPTSCPGRALQAQMTPIRQRFLA